MKISRVVWVIVMLGVSACGESNTNGTSAQTGSAKPSDPDTLCRRLAAQQVAAKTHETSMEQCLADVAEVKEKFPRGYDCIALCPSKPDDEVFMTCVLDCVMRDRNLEKLFEDQSKRRSDESSSPSASARSTGPASSTDPASPTAPASNTP